jgi:hypothetical protein
MVAFVTYKISHTTDTVLALSNPLDVIGRHKIYRKRSGERDKNMDEMGLPLSVGVQQHIMTQV